MISAMRWNQRVYKPTTTAGKVCRTQIPPSSCTLIENVRFSSSAKPGAPTFISSDASRAARVSPAALA